jgi:hypothetical protein
MAALLPWTAPLQGDINRMTHERAELAAGFEQQKERMLQEIEQWKDDCARTNRRLEVATVDVRSEQDRVQSVKEALEKKVSSSWPVCRRAFVGRGMMTDHRAAHQQATSTQRLTLGWRSHAARLVLLPLQRVKKRGWKAACEEGQQSIEELHSKLVGKQGAIDRLKQRFDALAVELAVLAAARTQEVSWRAAGAGSRRRQAGGRVQGPATNGSDPAAVSWRPLAECAGPNVSPDLAAMRECGLLGCLQVSTEQQAAASAAADKASIEQARAQLDAAGEEVALAASALLVVEGELDAAERVKQQLLVRFMQQFDCLTA